MADLQKQFRTFHDTISIDYEKKILAEKRDRILKQLKDGIAEQRKDGTTIPPYHHRNQGSYAMGTGIKPLGDDYDLDVALIFDTTRDDHDDPVKVKNWVYKALENHTKEVRVREPCVTVFYQKKGESIYHVDFAVYAKEASGRTFLARGKLGSSGEHKSWEESDPEGLLEALKNTFADEDDRAQLRRAIRYLKRWKDVNFSSEGNEAPRGIALTACAYRWFSPARHIDDLAASRTDDDMDGLLGLVTKIRKQFVGDRISVTLPVVPGNDLFADMSNQQMKNMRGKVQDLHLALSDATAEVDPHEAAKMLVGVFGDDFPIPPKSDTGKKKGAAAFVSSGISG